MPRPVPHPHPSKHTRQRTLRRSERLPQSDHRLDSEDHPVASTTATHPTVAGRNGPSTRVASLPSTVWSLLTRSASRTPTTNEPPPKQHPSRRTNAPRLQPPRPRSDAALERQRPSRSGSAAVREAMRRGVPRGNASDKERSHPEHANAIRSTATQPDATRREQRAVQTGPRPWTTRHHRRPRARPHHGPRRAPRSSSPFDPPPRFGASTNFAHAARHLLDARPLLCIVFIHSMHTPP